jgi:hypothetical protein
MAEDISFAPGRTHVVVTSRGPPSLDEMKQTLSALAQIRFLTGIDKVVVDSRARSGQPSTADLYRGAELLAESLGPGMRIAVLVARVEGDHDFFAKVCVHRGAIVAFFQDEQAALGWLLEDSEP